MSPDSEIIFMALGIWKGQIEENGAKTPQQYQMILRLEELRSKIVQKYSRMDFGCLQPIPNLNELHGMPNDEPPF